MFPSLERGAKMVHLHYNMMAFVLAFEVLFLSIIIQHFVGLYLAKVPTPYAVLAYKILLQCRREQILLHVLMLFVLFSS